MTLAVVFDVFATLLHFADDEAADRPWEVLASSLNAGGGATSSAEVKRVRGALVAAAFERADHVHADIDMSMVYRDLVDRLVPRAVDPDGLAAAAAWEFRCAATSYCDPYPGAGGVIASLATGRRIGVASNTQRIYTERELSRAGLGDAFDAVVFSSDVGRLKPDPLVLNTALDRLGRRPEESVYVGDNPVDDYVAAMAAGTGFILMRHEGPFDHASLGVPRSIPIARGYADLPGLIATMEA